MSFLTLPNELVVEVLLHSAPPDVARWILVCKRMRNAIQGSPRLSYSVLLVTTGCLHVIGRGGCGLTEGVIKLRQLRKYWEDIPWEDVSRYVLKDNHVYQLRGGTLIQSPNPNHHPDLGTPATIYPIPGSDWDGISVPDPWMFGLQPAGVHSLHIDPMKDLVIALNKTTQYTSHLLEVRTLAMGNHPESTMPTIHVPLGTSPPNRPAGTRIKVYNDFVAVRDRDLMIFNWKTGQRVSSLESRIEAFSFLPNGRLLTVTVYDTIAFINVFKLGCLDIIASWPTKLAGFALPQINRNRRIVAVTCRCDLGSTSPDLRPDIASKSSGFIADHNSSIVVIGITLDVPFYYPRPTPPNHTFTIIIQARTLLQLADYQHIHESPGPGIPWDAWGPYHTRFFDFSAIDTISDNSSGSRFARVSHHMAREHERIGDTALFPHQYFTTTVHVYDFNPFYSKPDIQHVEAPPQNPTVTYSARNRTEIVRSTTVVPKGEFFLENVTTRLPYRYTTNREPLNGCYLVGIEYDRVVLFQSQ